MKCVRRCMGSKPAFAATAPCSIILLGRTTLRPGGSAFTTAPSALRTSGSNAPLSLNDIIAFESQLPPSLVAQEVAPPEQKVDKLIDRAARVLQEVNSVLLAEAETTSTGAPDQQRAAEASEAPAPSSARRGGATTATLSRPRPGPESAAAPGSGAGAGEGGDGPGSSTAAGGAGALGGSELGRAVFGGSAQVSEREASRMRAALQRTLEGGSAAAPPAAAGTPQEPVGTSGRPYGDGGFLVFGEALLGPVGSPAPPPLPSTSSSATADSERPAWAQALFSSAAAATNPPTASGSGSTQAPSRTASGKVAAPSSSPTLPPAPSAAATRSSAPSSSGNGGSAPPAGPGAVASSPAPPLPPQLAPAPTARRNLTEWAPLAFAEADLSLPTELLLKSEESLFVEAARSAVLPPLQSVVDLTAAVRPPTRGLDLGGAAAPAEQHQAVSEAVSVSEEEVVQGNALGRRLADGAGRLADGTRFEKLSGTDVGPDGYVKKWEVLRGVTGDGRVQWEECWWQASNRYGLRELGAFKKGTAESGASWVEEWKEVLRTHPDNLRLVIERTAHKWARDENADEWEEKWGECFEEAGRVHKYADKWAKAGCNVWHERWGEDYDGRGACQKWTDKWAERLLEDGGQEQWGDKWTETFGDGKGTKHGEVWSSNSGGSRYNRWWNEEHYGDGRVRKWGDSTSGEHWDAVEHMDTYYNPVPHFGFGHAVGHSPQLWSVPLPAPDEADGSGGDADDDGLGVGLGRL